MAIVQALCNVYVLDVQEGLHQPGDDYKIALYVGAASLDKNTTEYTATGEVSGPGYVAGGMSLVDRVVVLDGDVAIVDFANSIWPVASISARGAMIYNATRANRALSVYDFGQDITSTNAEFRATLPPATAEEAVIQLSSHP